MRPPAPKTKVQEVMEILKNTKPSEGFSEFGYARCIRLLRDIESFTPEDQFNMLRSLIELNAGNLRKAEELALQNYENSQDFQVLRNATYVFQNTMALDMVVKTMEKISEISRKLKINPKETLPSSYQLSYFLSGKLNLAQDYYSNEDLKELLEDFHLVQETLEISNKSLEKILEIVHTSVLDHNAKYDFLEYSYIDEEFLLTIFLYNSYDEVSRLNTDVASRCYQEGLLDELNKISYLFLPSEVDQA